MALTLISSGSNVGRETSSAICLHQGPQQLANVGQIFSSMLISKRIQNAAAGNRQRRRVGTNDEALIGQRYNRRLESQLRKAACAWFDRASVVKYTQPSENLRRAEMNAHARTRTQCPRRIAQNVKVNVNDLRGAKPPNWRAHHATFDRS